MTDACIVRIAAPSELWLRSWPRISQTVTDVIVLAVQRSGKVHSLSEVSVVLSDDRELRILNNEHRGIDKPTNVLAFPGEPLEEEGEQGAYTVRDRPLVLGDVVLAYETVEREADEQGKKFEHHLTHLLVHGVLHLCGFDHDREADAQKMEDLERAILRELHIHDPYAEQIIAEMAGEERAAAAPPPTAVPSLPTEEALAAVAAGDAEEASIVAGIVLGLSGKWVRPYGHTQGRSNGKEEGAGAQGAGVARQDGSAAARLFEAKRALAKPKRALAKNVTRRPAKAARPKPKARKAPARKAAIRKPVRKAAKSKSASAKSRKAKR
ncbi:MAG: rRNA maturation RNase YbeY [Alphaproteobacteria bacterium]|nr:rRNA maturation RNase YbeY [Alphaproteobacteria bacterium]